MVRMVVLYPVKIAVLALLFWFAVRERMEGAAQGLVIGTVVVLAILLHIGIVAFITSFRRVADARLLKNSMRGELPRDGQRIAVAGTIEADGDLLKTPFTAAPCVLYEYEVYRMVTPRRAKSNLSQEKIVDFSGLAMAPASIRTGNGRFALCGFPLQASGYVRHKGHDEKRLAAARDYIGRTPFERTLPYVGSLAGYDRATLTKSRSVRLDSQMTDGLNVGDATFQEEYVPDGMRACAIGVYSAADHGLVAGRGAGQPVRLLPGEGAEVLQRLAGGVRSSRILASIMVLIVGAVLAFILYAPKETLDRVTGVASLMEMQQERSIAAV